MVTSSGRVLTVLYDADCGVCSATARVLRRIDRRHQLRLTPLQDASLPGSPSLAQLLDSLHAVDEDGRWWTGADAVVEIARRIPVLRPVTSFARLPLAPRILDAGYRAVAEHRQQLSRVLGMDVCRDPNHPSTRHRHEANAPARSLDDSGGAPMLASPEVAVSRRQSLPVMIEENLE
jgi:predicted DCC family thiol-disulfide oxidoreductase YuxK